MIAAVYHGRQDVRIEDVPEPSVGPGEVKIACAFNGICGTDLKEFYAGPMFTPVEPHPLTGKTIPVILGHEFSGTVVDVGRGVDDLAPGDRVAVEPIDWCDECEFCVRGDYNLCSKLAFHGVMTHTGGLAQYAVLKRRTLHKLPENVSLEQGALAEPMAVALHGAKRAVAGGDVEPDDLIAVYGAGPIGIGVYCGLRALGFQHLVVVEPSESRRRDLETIGAELIIDPGSTDAAAEILKCTGGRGVAASVDAAGAPASLLAAVRSTRKHGRVVSVAVFEHEVPIQPNDYLFSEISITSSMAYCNDFPDVIRYLSEGHYRTDSWVDHIALADIVEAGFERLRSQSASKILVDIGAAR